MTHLGFVTVAWLATIAIVAGFVLATFRRGRRLAEQVPPEERRWS